MHAEMPRHDESGKPVVGMQLWVDLPKALKKCEPRYRDLHAKEIPSVTLDSSGNVLNTSSPEKNGGAANQEDGTTHVKVISGHSHGVDSQQELAYTPVWLFDVTIKKGGRIVQTVPRAWTIFAYLFEGRTRFIGLDQGSKEVEQHNIVLFASANTNSEEPAVVAENAGDTDAHFGERRNAHIRA